MLKTDCLGFVYQNEICRDNNRPALTHEQAQYEHARPSHYILCISISLVSFQTFITCHHPL